jgi:hypothetical protein
MRAIALTFVVVTALLAAPQALADTVPDFVGKKANTSLGISPGIISTCAGGEAAIFEPVPSVGTSENALNGFLVSNQDAIPFIEGCVWG